LNQLSAQNTDNKKIIYLKGILHSLETGRPVPFAHIIDLNNRSITISDTSGQFSLTILKGDTLRFSSIGFDPYYFSLSDSTMNSEEYSTVFQLLTRDYDLGEVDVYRMRWAEFTFEFLNTETEANETGEKIKKLVFTDAIQKDLQDIKLSQTAGVLLAFDVPSWKTRSRAKVKEMEDHDQLQKLIEVKYNEKLVYAITGLKDKELRNFIDFCNLDPVYIINSTDYEIVNRIKSLYSSFKHQY
jgi:hypothetical protein